jgi:hypothetical protein
MRASSAAVRWSVVTTDDDVANRAESNHGCDVDRRLEAVERGPELGEGRELAARVILFSIARRARRARRSVLSDDDRRDALTHERLGARIAPEASVAVRVNVDEARAPTARPRASISIVPLSLDRRTTETIRPAVITTSSSWPGVPVPSKTVPFRTMMSAGSARAQQQGRRGENGGGARRCAKKIASRSHP